MPSTWKWEQENAFYYIRRVYNIPLIFFLLSLIRLHPISMRSKFTPFTLLHFYTWREFTHFIFASVRLIRWRTQRTVQYRIFIGLTDKPLLKTLDGPNLCGISVDMAFSWRNTIILLHGVPQVLNLILGTVYARLILFVYFKGISIPWLSPFDNACIYSLSPLGHFVRFSVYSVAIA